MLASWCCSVTVAGKQEENEMTKTSTVRFDRTGPTIVVQNLAVTDPAVVAEAHFWADGHRGPAATSEQLAEADLSNYVVQALAVGAQAIGTAGGVQQSYDIKDLVTEVSERTQQSSKRSAEATDAMVTKAAQDMASASEQTRKAIGQAAETARKDFGDQLDNARRALSAELQRLLGGESPEVTARLQPLIDRFGRDLVERSARQSEELMTKVARQFDPADPTSVLSQQNRLLADQHKLLLESLTKEHTELAGKVSELTTAVTVANAARSAVIATTRLTPLKGDTYAEPVHRVLEAIAAGLGDDYADTSAVAGAISRCKKGDGVLTIEGDDVRVVVEMSDSLARSRLGAVPRRGGAQSRRARLDRLGPLPRPAQRQLDDLPRRSEDRARVRPGVRQPGPAPYGRPAQSPRRHRCRSQRQLGRDPRRAGEDRRGTRDPEQDRQHRQARFPDLQERDQDQRRFRRTSDGAHPPAEAGRGGSRGCEDRGRRVRCRSLTSSTRCDRSPYPRTVPRSTAQTLTISQHAIQRYQERVEAMCRGRAERQLRRLVLDAHWYPLPRPWTQIVIHPGSHYGYSPRRADVCLVERDGVVRTVLSRMTVSAQRQKMSRRIR